MNRFLTQSLVLIISFAFTTSSVLAETNMAFSDATKIALTPNVDWSSKTIQYEKKHRGNLLTISLDQQQYPYLQPLIAQFAQHRNVTIDVSDGTCGVSAGKLRRKQVDIAGFCCPPSKSDRLPGLEFHTLGIGSLAIIANKNITVDNISKEQAQKIFKGEITTWNEVNENLPELLTISPIIRAHCNKRPGHWRLIVSNKSDFANNQTSVGSIPDMLKRTSKGKGAIGYETLWMIDQHAKSEPVKIINVDGYDPNNQDDLAQGNYPFYRTFSLTTWGKIAKPLANELITYLIQNINSSPGGKHTLVGADRLKQNGWIFNQGELISEPNNPLFGRREG